MHVMWTADAAWQLARLLLAGQLLATTLAIDSDPRRPRRFLAQSVIATALQIVVLLPLLGALTLVIVLVAAVLQRISSWLVNRRADANLRAVAEDLGVQLILLAAAWVVVTWAPRTIWLPEGPWQSTWATAAGALAVCWFVWRGGATLTALVLRGFPNLTTSGAEARMGRMIGILERSLILLMVAFDQWGAVGLVVAAKSLARFKALDKRHYAEYYLIGTLTSLLIACLGGLALKYLLAR